LALEIAGGCICIGVRTVMVRRTELVTRTWHSAVNHLPSKPVTQLS
jgi:hypothetical protein